MKSLHEITKNWQLKKQTQAPWVFSKNANQENKSLGLLHALAL